MLSGLLLRAQLCSLLLLRPAVLATCLTWVNTAPGGHRSASHMPDAFARLLPSDLQQAARLQRLQLVLQTAAATAAGM